MAEILIVDDDDLVRRALRHALEAVGHTVTEATNGLEALAELARHRPALVVTDILMPEKEGIGTIMEIRRIHGDLKIIAISGGGRTGQVEFLTYAQQVGADRVIKKPFSREELLGTVTDLIGPRPDQS